jgi:hypothetical protein
MSNTIHSLDFDTLVEKHVRLSPAIRYYQLKCLMFGSIPLLVLVEIAILIGIDLIGSLFGPSISWKLEFREVYDVLSNMLIPETVFDAIVLCTIVSFHIYATVSFISLRFNGYAYGALLLIWVQWITWFADRISFHFHEWQPSGGTGGYMAVLKAEALFVQDLWLLGLELCLLYLIARSLKIHLAMSREERDIIREGWAAPFHILNFLLAFGIPMNIRNSSRRVRTVMYSYLGNLVALFPPMALLTGGALICSLVMIALGPYLRWGWYNPDPEANAFAREPIFTLFFNIFLVLLSVPTVYLWVVAFRFAGNLCLRMSRRFLKVSLEQAQAADARRPVLFLRSFRDDAGTLPPPKSSFAYKLFNYGERNKSLDQLLLEEGTSLGPVVALGNPADAVPPYGAARVYFRDNDWQKMIAYLMEQAIAIVICVDNSESLWWEIKYVSQHHYLGKTLFLLHPKYGFDKEAADIVRDFEKVLGFALISEMNATGGKFMGLWFDGAPHLQVGVASQFSRAHYLLMLRWFLRSKMERIDTSRCLGGSKAPSES